MGNFQEIHKDRVQVTQAPQTRLLLLRTSSFCYPVGWHQNTFELPPSSTILDLFQHISHVHDIRTQYLSDNFRFLRCHFMTKESRLSKTWHPNLVLDYATNKMIGRWVLNVTFPSSPLLVGYENMGSIIVFVNLKLSLVSN